jgi:glycosidase
MSLRAVLLLAVAVVFVCLPRLAQPQTGAPVIEAIEPPEWWANMPAAMLLVRGEQLEGSTFTTSDARIAVASVKYSANGHWAAVHLNASPVRAEAVRLTATNTFGRAAATYSFGMRREAAGNFAGFSSKDVMYLLMIDRFADGDLQNDGTPAEHAAALAAPRGWHGGDLRGVMDHLDYLQTLGITTVWITPVYQNHEAGSYHGYGATNLYAVDEHYGTLGELKQLAAALHTRHMKLVLDTVPNHVGPAHPWVEDEPEPDWFHGTKADHHKAVGEFAPLVDPHAAWRDQRDILDGWFADVLPDMNQENADVAQYLTQNAIWWVEQTGADGLRIDTFPYVGRPFWHSFHAGLHALYPNLTTVGEVFNGDPVITSAFAGGVTRTDLDGWVDTGLTTPFDFPSYFAIRNILLHGAPMSQMAAILRQDSLYPHPERLVPFLGNHDTKRFLSEDGATPEKLRLAFAMLLTMRGMPEIYAGDEIAMTGGDDPENRHDFPGGFGMATGSAQENGFAAAGRTPAEQGMYDWVRQLLLLRSSYAELNAGEEQVLYADADTLLFVRGLGLQQGCMTGGAARVLVAINRSAQMVTVPLVKAETALEGCTFGKSLLGGGGSPVSEQLAVPGGASVSLWRR